MSTDVNISEITGAVTINQIDDIYNKNMIYFSLIKNYDYSNNYFIGGHVQ